jgi:hypothetical protein
MSGYKVKHCLAISSVLALLGCSSSPGDGGKVASYERTGTTEEALTNPFQEFSWTQGQAPVVMWPKSQGYCYLSGTTGHYAGGGEAVWVEMDAANNTFLLNGRSGQSGVGGWALCVNWHDLNSSQGASWTWNNWVTQNGYGDSFVQLWNYHSRCFLGGLSGSFNGGGEYSFIYELNLNQGSWDVYADNQSSGQISSDGSCLSLNGKDYNSFISQFHWDQGNPSTNMGSASNRVCFLTGVAGCFRGTGERVKLSVVNNTWFLGGASGQAGVHGDAECYTSP